MYATGRNITVEKTIRDSLKKTEQALHQAQKMEAIGRMIGNVAHDFNNLLHVISTSAAALSSPRLDAQRQTKFLAAIENTAERGTKLTSQLLAFSRRSPLEPVLFNVHANIRSLQELMGALIGSRMQLEIKGDKNLWVFADSNQFDTAIINLVVNARDAMDGEGVLQIEICPVPDAPGRTTGNAAAGDFVAVSIADRGSGIPEDLLDSIFEPFFTTKPEGRGTGLGLSQAFGFVKQSGGEISVESKIGVGSTFTLYLPRTLPPESEKLPPG